MFRIKLRSKWKCIEAPTILIYLICTVQNIHEILTTWFPALYYTWIGNNIKIEYYYNYNFFFANWIHDNYLTQIEFICCCLWFTMHWWGFIAVVVQCIVRWCDSEACKTYTHKTAGNNQNKIYQHQLNNMRKSLLRANGLMSKYIECTFNLRAPSTKFFHCIEIRVDCVSNPMRHTVWHFHTTSG